MGKEQGGSSLMNRDNSSNNCSSDVDNHDVVITDLYRHCVHHFLVRYFISSLYHFFALWISILQFVCLFCITKLTFRDNNCHLVADAV